jgi:transcriptional regulator with XRE-family HTH domain
MMTPTEFRERRQFLGYTQEGIAERLGLSRRSIQAYESGETTISRVIEMAIEAIELEEK